MTYHGYHERTGACPYSYPIVLFYLFGYIYRKNKNLKFVLQKLVDKLIVVTFRFWKYIKALGKLFKSNYVFL